MGRKELFMKKTLTAVAHKDFTTFVTHGGVFHADDVFTTALLQLIFGVEYVKERLVRTFQVPKEQINDPTCLVFDIGMGQYDHHQKDSAEWSYHESGVRKAAFGLVWSDMWPVFFSDSKYAATVEKGIVEPIDAQDNGEARNPLSTLIHGFNPNWDEGRDFDSFFWDAVDVARPILEREIVRAQSLAEAEDEVQAIIDASERDDILVCDKYIPLSAGTLPASYLYVVNRYENRGLFNITALSEETEDGSFKNKKLLPEEWVTNPPEGLGFIHPARFIAGFDSYEHALAAAEMAVKA